MLELSDIQQKWIILQCLSRICKRTQTLVDIFINYDCDLNEKDLFGLMVEAVSRIAQTSIDIDSVSNTSFYISMKILALECLVIITDSFVEFLKPIHAQTLEITELAKEDIYP